MNFALLITAPPLHEQAWHALHFCEAARAQGHTVERVFFYGDGVLHGNLLNTPPLSSLWPTSPPALSSADWANWPNR